MGEERPQLLRALAACLGSNHNNTVNHHTKPRAKEYQATLVIDDGFWRDAGGHGAFPLVRRLLGLYRFMSTSELDALKTQFSPPLKVINVQQRQELHEIFGDKSGGEQCSVLVNMDAAGFLLAALRPPT